MKTDDEKLAETKWREELRMRLKQARGPRTQQDVADFLGISQTRYSKYESSRASMMPTRLLPRFCKLCGVDLYWLIEGPKAAAAKTVPRKRRIA